MATLVSHAMRRYPTTPDAGYSSHGIESSTSRQSWSQIRDAESALSRSMRYAEPWLYGSVRAPSSVLLTPALVLCSCADYVNGTKKSSKKGSSVCKKCKGTRIPLPTLDASKFGTVRCYPTTPLAITTPLRAGTARVTSKSRPTILPLGDPYDAVRRSRLAAIENGSQFKPPQSLSPVRSKSNVNFPTIGRKSILECNVNPYDLINTDAEPQDASITFVSGQRIRIRPKVVETEYEDIQVQQSVPQATKKENGGHEIKNSALKSNEKESECNRFKSILKKPTTTFSDTDLNGGPERSPSPAPKSGSYFYLRLPGNTPRKKVQFLVENEVVLHSENEPHYENNMVKADAHDETSVGNLPKRTESNHESNDETVEVKDTTCKLRRSISERVHQEQEKVLFHDTMALRYRTERNDSRGIFNEKEFLRKLDGVTTVSKLKSFEKVKPRGPPPEPPKNVQNINIHRKENQPREQTKISKELSSIDTEIFEISNKSQSQSKEESLTVNENFALLETPEKHTKDEAVNDADINCMKILENIKNPKENDTENNIDSNIVNIKNQEVDTNKIKSQSIKISSPDMNLNKHPSPPPRKRSSNKQPFLTITSIPITQKIKIENSTPIQEVQNKTIVKIGSTPISPTVHKLKIKNDFLDVSVNNITVSDYNQGKTSIMINGDDCYCTVNVNDDVPLYQSSVIVKEPGIKIESNTRRSSSVYITGSFVDSVESKSDEPKLNTENAKPDNENDNKINNEELYLENSKTNITAKSDNEIQTDIPTSEESVNSEKENITHKSKNYHEDVCSTELLKRILCDPVEAVKRNLVPHVCGKSNITTRRSLKRKKTEEINDFIDSCFENSLLPHTIDDFDINPVTQLIEESFMKLRNHDGPLEDDRDAYSENSSSTQYEVIDPGSDCYTDNSNRSSVTEEELSTRSKFYDLLADSAVEVFEGEDHHYESIKASADPIYEEIEIPPPLPTNPPPPSIIDDLQLDKEFTTRSIFEGASKYDILSYLVDAKERGIVPEDSYTFNFGNTGIVIEDDGKETSESFNKSSHVGAISDSSEDSSLVMSGALIEDKLQRSVEVERNDSGVGSETSKSSLSKYRSKVESLIICEDCEGVVDLQEEHAPLICRKCLKRRTERKEIIMEVVETEEKYSRDLQIILEEFYQPMLVAGLLTSDQLSAIFLNVEELLENSQALAERLRDAVEIATEQGDEDLLTVNIGKLFLEAAPMLHAFETYCVRQGAASLLLASLEKEKELLRIFLRVSQMENTVLRRMNLNSFLMVPVQRVTKYPLLLARLYKVTPAHHDTREQLKEAQTKIELHLNHINSETKDVPSKLWRRISNNPGRRASSEMDLVNIKLRKIAVDVLEWNHEEANFILENKLLFTQPTDNNWRKGRTIKLTPINALLVTNGKTLNTANRPEPSEETLVFSRHSGVREAALLLIRDKNGRYSLLREPLYLDRCIIAADPAWQNYFEVQELLGRDTFIFKADNDYQTRIWYRHLQYYAQGMGAWRKRRNALANIMINGMGLRS